MKTIIIFVLVLATASLGTVYVLQSRKVAQQQAQAAAQRAEVEEKAKAVAALEQAQEQNEQQRRELLRQSDALVAQVRAQQTAVSNQLAAKLASVSASADPAQKGKDQAGGFGSFLSKMMDDPDTRKLIRDTQRTMMDQLYAPLVKQMGLAPEEADKLKDLLADNAMKATEQASAMFGGLSSSNRTEVASKMADQQKSFDADVKALLGDDRYAQYKAYQDTVGERMQLSQYKQQLAGADHPLTDQQTEQLLAFMKDEKQSVAASTGQPMPSSGQDPATFEAMLSEDKLNAMLANLTTVNQRVYDRAKDVLSPDQLDAFGKFQTNQAQMMRAGMSMARKMFSSPDKTQPAATPGTP